MSVLSFYGDTDMSRRCTRV